MAIEEASTKSSVLAHEPSRRTVIAVFVALMVCEVIGSLDQTIVSRPFQPLWAIWAASTICYGLSQPMC